MRHSAEILAEINNKLLGKFLAYVKNIDDKSMRRRIGVFCPAQNRSILSCII
jgi:hypothetical protein